MLICVCFFVLFIPTALIIILDPMPPSGKMPWLHVIGYILNWCSAFINPFIYVFTNETYRTSFKKTLKLNTVYTTWEAKLTPKVQRRNEYNVV